MAPVPTSLSNSQTADRDQSGGRRLVAAVVALVLLGVAPAMAADKAKDVPQDPSKITSLDEVVVTGKLDSLSGIRQALKESAQRFYARYNELNKDRDYDIICRHEAPTGSQLAVDTCQAQIVEEKSAEQAQAILGGHPGTVPMTPMSVLRNDAAAEMRKRALVLLKSDPELMQALLEHARLEQMYTDMRRKKFKGWPGVR